VSKSINRGWASWALASSRIRG